MRTMSDAERAEVRAALERLGRQIGEALEMAQRLLDAAAPPPALPSLVEQVIAEHPHQDSLEHTCQRCGRTGSRQFVYNPPSRGWLCKRADACEQRLTARSELHGLDLGTLRADLAQLTAPVTARCQDCTRTWTLTGAPLRFAVDAHELKHLHIVTIVKAKP